MSSLNSVSWSEPIEKLVKRIGEQSMCYSILHRRSQSYYAYYNHFVAIPSILLSSITAAITFAVGGSDNAFSSSVLLGSLNTLTAFIGTLGSYFRFAQLSENHRIVAIQYNKIYQTISQQLALNRELRDPADRVLNNLRDSLERLQEVAPEIPKYCITHFKKDYANYTDISRPHIANGLESIEVNTEPPSAPRSAIPSIVISQIESPPEITIASVPQSSSNTKPATKHWK